jgi:hypothetical protein
VLATAGPLFLSGPLTELPGVFFLRELWLFAIPAAAPLVCEPIVVLLD